MSKRTNTYVVEHYLNSFESRIERLEIIVNSLERDVEILKGPISFVKAKNVLENISMQDLRHYLDDLNELDVVQNNHPVL